MKVGDLVWLDPKQFYEYDEDIGIILDIVTTPDGELVKVYWSDNHIAWLHEFELEIVNGKRN